MSGLVAIAAIVFVALCIAGTVAVIVFVLKVLFWVVLFPIRLAFKLAFGILGVGFAAIVAPLVLVIGGIAIVGALLAALFAIVAPLLPVILLGLVGWAIYRASVGPSARGFAGS
jgi:hypothetical protein